MSPYPVLGCDGPLESHVPKLSEQIEWMQVLESKCSSDVDLGKSVIKKGSAH